MSLGHAFEVGSRCGGSVQQVVRRGGCDVDRYARTSEGGARYPLPSVWRSEFSLHEDDDGPLVGDPAVPKAIAWPYADTSSRPSTAAGPRPQPASIPSALVREVPPGRGRSRVHGQGWWRRGIRTRRGRSRVRGQGRWRRGIRSRQAPTSIGVPIWTVTLKGMVQVALGPTGAGATTG